LSEKNKQLTGENERMKKRIKVASRAGEQIVKDFDDVPKEITSIGDENAHRTQHTLCDRSPLQSTLRHIENKSAIKESEPKKTFAFALLRKKLHMQEMLDEISFRGIPCEGVETKTALQQLLKNDEADRKSVSANSKELKAFDILSRAQFS
jgi:hypothetical protein